MAFHEAEPAGFGHRVVGRGSTNNAPDDGVRNHSVVEVPDVSAHPFPLGPVVGVVVPDIGHLFGGSCVLPGDLALYMTDSTLHTGQCDTGHTAAKSGCRELYLI